MTASVAVSRGHRKEHFVQHMHAVTQTAEKFYMKGMHTFHTDTVYNTLGRRDPGFWGNVTESMYKCIN